MDDALKQLRDLHLPESPGLWPPAPGWWVVAFLATAACVYLAIRLYRAYQRGRPLRLALGNLDVLLAAARDGRLATREYANSVNELLKRAVIYGARRADAAPLTGPMWLEYLDRIVSSQTFSAGPGAALGNGRFTPEFVSDPVELHAAARDVLRALKKQTRVMRRSGTPT